MCLIYCNREMFMFMTKKIQIIQPLFFHHGVLFSFLFFSLIYKQQLMTVVLAKIQITHFYE